MNEVKPPATELPTPAGADVADAELVRRVAGGERAAAAALIERHQRPLRAFLWRWTGDAGRADDLAQETFLRLLRYADRYDPRYPLRTWLFTIARRLAINEHHRARRAAAGPGLGHLAAGGDDPRRQVERDDQRAFWRRRLEAGLAQLSPAQRETILLYHQQQMPLEEVAGVLELPLGTVKSHLHRGRAALRRLLQKAAQELEP